MDGKSSEPFVLISEINWRPPSQIELTPMIFNMGLTHLDSEASNYNTFDYDTFPDFFINSNKDIEIT